MRRRMRRRRIRTAVRLERRPRVATRLLDEAVQDPNRGGAEAEAEVAVGGAGPGDAEQVGQLGAAAPAVQGVEGGEPLAEPRRARPGGAGVGVDEGDEVVTCSPGGRLSPAAGLVPIA
jgi:hypothetical protein